MSITRMIRHIITVVSIVLIVTAGLTSCLQVTADIALDRNGRVDLRLEYLLSPHAADFGRGFGSDEPWPLPLTDKDFLAQTLRVPGSNLMTYRNRTLRDGSELISVRLKFETAAALAEYLQIGISCETGDSGGLMILELPGGSPVNPEAAAALSGLSDSTVFRFSFKAPSAVLSGTPGELDGRVAKYELTLSELMNGLAAERWIVRW